MLNFESKWFILCIYLSRLYYWWIDEFLQNEGKVYQIGNDKKGAVISKWTWTLFFIRGQSLQVGLFISFSVWQKDWYLMPKAKEKKT